MDLKPMLKFIVYIILGIALVFLINWPTNTDGVYKESELFSAKILEKLGESTEGNDDFEFTTVKYTAIITDERRKNEQIQVEDIFDANSSYHIRAKKGDNVLLFLEMGEDGTTINRAYIANYKRQTQVYILLVIFVVLLLLVGRMKGLKALISLALTLLLVVKVLIPQILQGKDPITLSIIIAIIITVVTMIIVSGFNGKSLATILGTVGGVLLGGILAILISSDAKIIGLTLEEIQFLQYIPQGTKFSFSGLLFATILLGALGAVMDVSMSIASAIEELKMINPNLSIRQLYQSGMNIGRDVMGTMINTLILAYTGSSICLLILYIGHNTPLQDIINNDIVVTEIIRAFAGTIGIIIAIPLTAIIAATVYSKKKFHHN